MINIHILVFLKKNQSDYTKVTILNFLQSVISEQPVQLFDILNDCPIFFVPISKQELSKRIEEDETFLKNIEFQYIAIEDDVLKIYF